MKLELYKRDFCPYCRKVMDYLEKNNRTDVEIKDVAKDPEAKKTLIEVGGKEQVPCLFIDGRPMYESGDIIEWLDADPQS